MPGKSVAQELHEHQRLLRVAHEHALGDVVPQALVGGGGGWRHGGIASAIMCKHLLTRSHMATNLALDQDLLDHAFRLSGEPTKKAAVTRALQEFIARREQRQVAELFGKLEWDPGYDYKAERERQR